MADKTSTFTTRIFLNDQQAKSKLESLEKDIKRLRSEQEAAANAGDWTKFEQVKKDLKQANKEMGAMKTSAQKVSHVLDNLKTSSIKEIRQTMGAINRELKSGSDDGSYQQGVEKRCSGQKFAGMEIFERTAQAVQTRTPKCQSGVEDFQKLVVTIFFFPQYKLGGFYTDTWCNYRIIGNYPKMRQRLC